MIFEIEYQILKILIIKKGAAGDVVRTTTLLNVLQGEISWVVDPGNKWLFPHNFPNLQLITHPNNSKEQLYSHGFDLVLSLEETEECASLASSIQCKKLVGVSLENKTIAYDEHSSGWFDMSLVSKKGRDIANGLKRKNTHSFQYWLFKMIGREFNGEPYVIYRNPSVKKIPGLIGIETRTGETWPNKGWTGYPELIQRLTSQGFSIRIFTQKENVREYLDDIASCSCIISGDSLPMHVALAYNIPCITLFSCTPPAEIYNYGSLRAVVSPVLEKSLYRLGMDETIISAISVSEVYKAFEGLSLNK